MGSRNIDYNAKFNQAASSFPTAAAVFAHNPYNDVGADFYPVPNYEEAPPTYAPTYGLPEGTLHLELWGRVPFVPYPSTEFVAPPPPMPKSDMVRVFLGQLPYQVTDMQLQWLCYMFGNGGAVYFPERIMKRDEKKDMRLPTGCIHAYCDPAILEALALGMHKKILVDDTGVWVAQDDFQQQELRDYSAFLKADPRRRVPNRPYDTVVVQTATSTYHPPMNRRRR
jgi:hypothetical protein